MRYMHVIMVIYIVTFVCKRECVFVETKAKDTDGRTQNTHTHTHKDRIRLRKDDMSTKSVNASMNRNGGKIKERIDGWRHRET